MFYVLLLLLGKQSSLLLVCEHPEGEGSVFQNLLLKGHTHSDYSFLITKKFSKLLKKPFHNSLSLGKPSDPSPLQLSHKSVMGAQKIYISIKNRKHKLAKTDHEREESRGIIFT